MYASFLLLYIRKPSPVTTRSKTLIDIFSNNKNTNWDAILEVNDMAMLVSLMNLSLPFTAVQNSRIWKWNTKICLTKSDIQLIPDISRTKNDKRIYTVKSTKTTNVS